MRWEEQRAGAFQRHVDTVVPLALAATTRYQSERIIYLVRTISRYNLILIQLPCKQICGRPSRWPKVGSSRQPRR
eukprot:COSAG06_NODE_1323_length_9859_cov_3.820082_6_plen_75_part_00